MSPLTSTDANFARDTAQGLVLVDFWAPWCGPCQLMGPILESLSSQVSKDVKIMKHNVDNEPAMAQKFNIRGIPTMVLLRDGRAVETLVGVRNEKQLLEVIERHKA